MHIRNWMSILGMFALFTFMAACAMTTSPGSTVTPTYGASDYGYVHSIELVKTDKSDVGLGTIAGAVVGGLVGHQIGQGRGNTAATIAGAAGGAVAGHEIEKRSAGADQVYRFHVRMDNGADQIIDQETNPNLRVGDRIRVINGTVQPA